MPFDSESAKQAGQKSKRGVSDRTKLLNDLLKPEKAKVIFKVLEKKAEQGDMDAIKTYLAYCFGKPKETHDIGLSEEAVNIIMSRVTDGR
jgi:hypothetical protein